jgi:uncharacterized protein (TIGR03437 family)
MAETTRGCIFLGLLAVSAAGQNIEWYRQFNHPNGTGSHGYGVAAFHGSIYVASLTGGAVLWKYDQAGNQIWERDLAGQSHSAFAVAAGDSGVYVVGDANGLTGQSQIFNDGAFIRKYDPDGNEIWTRLFAVPEVVSSTAALGVALDSTGVYIAGYADGTLPGQAFVGNQDIFVRKYDFNGNEMWTREFGQGAAMGIAANSSGIYVTGRGGVTVAGETGSEFLRKYDANGSLQWTHQFGGNLEDFSRGVAVDATGVYVAGSAQTKLPGQSKIDANYDGFVRKFDFAGKEVWNAEWGNGSVDDAWAVAADGTGVYIAGRTDRAFPGQLNVGQTDSYVRKYDSNGNLQWTKQFGAPAVDWPYALAIDETGGYVAGWCSGSFPTQKWNGGTDVYLVKLTGIAPPTISLVANAFGDTPLIAPNTWVEIKGGNLGPAGDARIWQNADFGTGLMPTSLDRVSVTVNGKPAYVYYISPTQVDILTPPDALPASVQIQLANGDVMSNIMTVSAQPYSLSFFVFDGAHVTGTHVDGSLLGPSTLYPGFSTPAKPGEMLVLYANGFGPTSDAVVSGIVTQSGTLSPLPTVTIGGANASVTFAGLVSPGTFQFNVAVPSSVPDGDNALTATFNNLATQKGVVLTVQR